MWCWVHVELHNLRCHFQLKTFYDSIALHCTTENQIKFRVEQQICFFVRKWQIMKAWKLRYVWMTLSTASMQDWPVKQSKPTAGD